MGFFRALALEWSAFEKKAPKSVHINYEKLNVNEIFTWNPQSDEPSALSAQMEPKKGVKENGDWRSKQEKKDVHLPPQPMDVQVKKAGNVKDMMNPKTKKAPIKDTEEKGYTTDVRNGQMIIAILFCGLKISRKGASTYELYNRLPARVLAKVGGSTDELLLLPPLSKIEVNGSSGMVLDVDMFPFCEDDKENAFQQGPRAKLLL